MLRFLQDIEAWRLDLPSQRLQGVKLVLKVCSVWTLAWCAIERTRFKVWYNLYTVYISIIPTNKILVFFKFNFNESSLHHTFIKKRVHCTRMRSHQMIWISIQIIFAILVCEYFAKVGLMLDCTYCTMSYTPFLNFWNQWNGTKCVKKNFYLFDKYITLSIYKKRYCISSLW